MLGTALWHCMWGRGQEGAMAPAPLCRISVTPFTTHNQIGTLWWWFPSAWACARSRPLWVSPTTSPVRLGVSPAATSTPTDVFNQRFEALLTWAGALGYTVCFAPLLFLPVYLCVNVGPQALLAVTLPAPFVPQSTTSLGPPGCWESSAPHCLSLPLLLVWMNVSSLSP